METQGAGGLPVGVPERIALYLCWMSSGVPQTQKQEAQLGPRRPVFQEGLIERGIMINSRAAVPLLLAPIV